MRYGIDEAGRGCLAGPVTAACVGFPDNFSFNNVILNDSKALPPSMREISAQYLRLHAFWGIGWAYPHEIDKYNIHHATLLAMKRAFYQMKNYINKHIVYKNVDFMHEEILVDGLFTPQLPIKMTAKIKGDTYIPQIQAASILAKTSRDALMRLLHASFPHYHFYSHKGYPTKRHKQAIKYYGMRPCIHRKHFCRNIFVNNKTISL